MSRLFVTGGAGFIGSHVVRQALLQGHEVQVWDNFSTGSINNLPQSSLLTICTGDILSAENLLNAVRHFRTDCIIHLAAVVSVPASIQDPDHCYNINIGGSQIVAQVATQVGCPILFASSAAVYGSQSPPLDESMVTSEPMYKERLLSPYAISKWEGEKIFLAQDIPATIFRFFNVYGERQPVSGSYPAVVPIFIQALLRDKPITIFGDGEQTRDFVYAGDIASGILSAVNYGQNNVFNLGSGQNHTVNHLVQLLASLSALPVKVEHADPRPGDIRHSYCRIDHAIDELGFSVGTDLRQGLTRTMEFFATLPSDNNHQNS